MKKEILDSYIGDKKIKELERTGINLVNVEFEDGNKIKIHNDLLEMIVRPVKNESSVTDTIIHLIATKFVAELADYGLEFYLVNNIARGMETLAHNLREEAVGKAFGCTGNLDIRLNELI